MFVPKPETEGRELPPGFAPRREIPDEEFAVLEAEYEAQFSADQKGAIRALYDHVSDEPATKRKARSAGGDD